MLDKLSMVSHGQFVAENETYVFKNLTGGNESASESDSEELLLPVMLTVFYLILLPVGTIGNMITILVTFTDQRFRSKTHILLCNLAISDLIMLSLGIIFDLFVIWRPMVPLGGDWFCFFKAFILETVSDVSVMTITVVTIDRWLAICGRPFELPLPVNYRKMFHLLISIWLVAIFAAGFHAWQYTMVPIYEIPSCEWEPSLNRYEIVNIDYNNSDIQYGQCDVRMAHKIPHLSEMLSIVFFFFPMGCLVCGYGLIMWELHKSMHTSCIAPCSRSCSVSYMSRKTSIRMLLAVVVIFFISHLPLQIQRMLTFNKNDEWICSIAMLDFLIVLYILSGFLHFFSSASNPYVYLIFSRRFRSAFRHLAISLRDYLVMLRTRFYRQCCCCGTAYQIKQTESLPDNNTSVTKRFGMKLRNRLLNISPENDRASLSPTPALDIRL